jgi:drug/metabolite transporter (DMT)-like permease
VEPKTSAEPVLQDKPISASRNAALISVMLVLDSLFFVWARLMLPQISPVLSSMFVMSIGTIEIGIVAFIKKQIHFRVLGKYIWFFLAIGFLIAASTYVSYEAVAYIDPGTASMLNRIAIIMQLFLGFVWLKERFNRIQLGGTILAIVGVFVITYQNGDYFRVGSLLVLVATLAYSLHTAMVKRYAEQMDFFEFFFFRLLCTSLFLILFNSVRHTLAWPSAKAWPLLILVASIDVALGRSLYYIALKRLNLNYFTILQTISPLLTVLWSLLLFSVLPGLQQIIGGMAVIAGVYIVSHWKQAGLKVTR